MATKKAKGKKAKKTKKKKAKKVMRKKVARRTVKKKAAKKKVKAKGKKTAAKAAPARSAAPMPGISAAPPAGERIGLVTHYFTHLAVAIVQIENGSLREGDTVQIKGHTSDFQQRIESMELDHVHVAEAHAGQSVGLRVKEHAREHDVVYKLR